MHTNFFDSHAQVYSCVGGALNVIGTVCSIRATFQREQLERDAVANARTTDPSPCVCRDVARDPDLSPVTDISLPPTSTAAIDLNIDMDTDTSVTGHPFTVGEMHTCIPVSVSRTLAPTALMAVYEVYGHQSRVDGEGRSTLAKTLIMDSSGRIGVL